MDLSEKMSDIIHYILNQATRSELELVGEALRRRMERESTIGMGQIDVNHLARTMAEGIEKQMGIGGDAVHQTSRRLVADMIRKEQPDISERDLQKLVDQFVPGGRAAGASGVPRDMLLAMITQFLSYSLGEMSEADKKQYPDGWYKKYWAAFPPDIQKLLREYINGRIGKNQFWNGVKDSPSMLK
jgi:hypothetical protein